MKQRLLRTTTLLFASALLPPVPRAADAATAPDVLPPVTLLKTIYLPEIIGDFDHFAVDMKRNHLFVSAEVHHSVEMFDLKTGEHLKSIGGVKTPHSLAFDAAKDELLIADGGDSSLILLDPSDFHRIDRVQLIDGSTTGKGDSPDAAYYDVQTHLYYIGNGGISANQPDSTISIFSPAAGKIVDQIKVPGNNLESMIVDDGHHRLYVNVRDKKEIGVVDLKSRQLVTTWTTPDMNKNTALTFDPATGRLFVAGRNPGILYVFDVNTGKLVSQMPCVNMNDDMTWDPAMKRLYVSGSQGLSIFQQNSPDKYTELLNLPTNGGKTSIYVRAVDQLYVIHPKTDIDMAGLLVYRVNRNKER
jgi:DNA-binding beta-propeller fold protein YncE